MGSAGDDGVVDPRAHPDEGDRGGSFDPGLETGYLRRAPRDRDLSPELGAVPFDPGPGHYDDRRARKAAKRQARADRQQREQEPGRSVPEQTHSDSADPPTQVALATGAAPPDDAPPDFLLDPPAEVVRPRRPEPMADRLERLRVAREREELERRARIEQERVERERIEREGMERRRRERVARLRKERAALRPATGEPVASHAGSAARKSAVPKAASKASASGRVRPGVQGPVRRRQRAAENRRRAAARRTGLFWPTAKAGLAVTVVLALSAGIGSALRLPVPGLDAGTGHGSLASSASLFGVDQGTPQGLSAGYVFPLQGAHDFGDSEARFGATRYGHIHEGQDIFGKTGTPEVAVHDGVVVDRGKNSDPDSGGRGNFLAIYSPDDNHSFVYMHMLKPARVQLGQQVHAGEVIGQLGCTGSCEGPHLHFEVRIGKASLGADTKPVDPLPYLRQWPQPTPG
jgi:murein DD-endopeptidase MepM/ murein hydrolase activator NlpD